MHYFVSFKFRINVGLGLILKGFGELQEAMPSYNRGWNYNTGYAILQ
jgi:hypothetical protein